MTYKEIKNLYESKKLPFSNDVGYCNLFLVKKEEKIAVGITMKTEKDTISAILTKDETKIGENIAEGFYPGYILTSDLKNDKICILAQTQKVLINLDSAGKSRRNIKPDKWNPRFGAYIELGEFSKDLVYLFEHAASGNGLVYSLAVMVIDPEKEQVTDETSQPEPESSEVPTKPEDSAK